MQRCKHGLNWGGYGCNFGDYSAWNDSLHKKKESPSGGTPIGGVEPSQGSLINGGKILKNTAHFDCSYFKNFDLFF